MFFRANNFSAAAHVFIFAKDVFIEKDQKSLPVANSRSGKKAIIAYLTSKLKHFQGKKT